MIVNNKHNNVCISFRNFGCEQISFVKSKDAPRLIPRLILHAVMKNFAALIPHCDYMST